ncbi:MAG: hypothetical protein ACC662_06195, partial [Planctomycetota bacterium]
MSSREPGAGEVATHPVPREIPARADLRGIAGISGAVVRDLAVAFRTSAEALEGVRELQAELVRALKRQDRSEIVLQSTQALNDTFRNLTAVQRALLERLEGGGHGTQGRIVPLMLIGLLIVFLGGIYAVIVTLDQVRAERLDAAAVAERATTNALAAFRQGMEDQDQAGDRDVARLREEIDRMREKEQALREKLDAEGASSGDLLKQIRILEAELEGLAAQVLVAQNEVLAKRALEQEVRAAASREAVLQPRLEETQRILDEERKENSRLRRRLAALGYGLPDPEGETPAPAKPPFPDEVPATGDPRLSGKRAALAADVVEAARKVGAEEEEAARKAATAPAPPGKPGPRVDRDPRLLDKIRDTKVVDSEHGG